MRRWLAERTAVAEAPPVVRLELSGPRLTRSLSRLVADTEEQGGLERYVGALKFKNTLFRDAFNANSTTHIDINVFKSLCAFMATVRRRIARWLEQPDFDTLCLEVVDLVQDMGDTSTTDTRLAAFGRRLGAASQERWVRDLAAELLHNIAPERYPLMTRWVWDAAVNTGVLREIWFAEDVDHVRIEAPDGYATFLTLREELSRFLTQNGFFRDILCYVDLLCAQVYAEYICEQGASYLRTDFGAAENPLMYMRRLLGLDGVKAGSGRTRLKTLDGESFVLNSQHPL
jgi:hypothetical protein